VGPIFFPVGRKAGGFTFHHCRNSAATDLAATGLTIEDVMAVGGWKTAAVARRYNLGNLDALRARIVASREQLGEVVPLRRRGVRG
jgi:hypothetical protein